MDLDDLSKDQEQSNNLNQIVYQLMVEVDGNKVTSFEYNDINDNSLNVNWWNNLTAEWKDIFLFNIDIATKIEDKHQYLIWLSSESNYSRIVGEKYVKLQNYKVDDILEKAYLLDKFYVHNNSDYSFDLKPLSKLQNLKLLKISVIFSNSDPISKLAHLTTLEIGQNFANLAPLIKLKNLKSLNIRLNESGLNPPKELIKNIKANGGTVKIWDDENSPF